MTIINLQEALHRGDLCGLSFLGLCFFWISCLETSSSSVQTLHLLKPQKSFRHQEQNYRYTIIKDHS